MAADRAEYRSPKAPAHSLFPLIRRGSAILTRAVLRTPATPNQITFASLISGLGAAACYAAGDRAWSIAGAFLLTLSYLLDNTDGEIARAKNLTSRLGAILDDLSDWLVHTALFLALGTAASRNYEQDIWLWLGIVAAAGSTINYILVQFLAWRRGSIGDPYSEKTGSCEESGKPIGSPSATGAWIVYVFRELFRADFWLVLLVLTFFDLAWVLLPLGAVGAQVYWIMALAKEARDFHV